MKTISFDVYSFDELSEDAQRAARENSPFDFSDDYGDDYRATLKAFEDIFDIKVYRYSVGGCYCPDWDFVTAGRADDAPDGDALRLARFMWNNYAGDILKGKYYSTRGEYINGKYIYKSRRSKIKKTMDDCPLTGSGTDYYILDPVVDCLHYKRRFDSYRELIDECLYEFFRAWAGDIEYCNDFEYFADGARANGWMFTEDGEFYKGA